MSALLTRRSLIVGAAGLLVAPAVVRVGSIMPVRAVFGGSGILTVEEFLRESVAIWLRGNDVLRIIADVKGTRIERC